MSENSYLRSNFPQRKTLIFVDMIKFFCNKSGCLIRFGPDRKMDITTWDVGHLTPAVSDYLARNLLVDIITEDNISASQ